MLPEWSVIPSSTSTRAKLDSVFNPAKPWLWPESLGEPAIACRNPKPHFPNSRSYIYVYFNCCLCLFPAQLHDRHGLHGSH